MFDQLSLVGRIGQRCAEHLKQRCKTVQIGSSVWALPPDPGPGAKATSEPGDTHDQEDEAAICAGIQRAGCGAAFRAGSDLRELVGGAGEHLRATEDVAS